MQIDYSSLVDVRIVKHGNLNTPEAVPNGDSKVAVGDQTSAWGLWPKKNGETQARRQGINFVTCEKTGFPRSIQYDFIFIDFFNFVDNGKKISAWEEISEALNAKKAQLVQVDDSNKAESSGRSSWSNRALRGSALGPTMARLRCQNGI